MELVKSSIKELKEYKCRDIPYNIKLDSNEGRINLFDDNYKAAFELNLYPDNSSYRLREEMGRYLAIDPENIIAGNGSSEMIELVIKTFVDKGEKVLSFIPTFSMYSVYSRMHSVNFVGVRCKEDFSLDINDLIKKTNEMFPKVIFLCNPNNPTGFLLSKGEIEKLLKNTKAIVVVDEAYIEFGGESMIEEIDKYNNLIVLRTLSKAFGLAAARVGFMVSNQEIISWANKVKTPYNLNSVSQYIAENSLKSSEKIVHYVKEVKRERNYIYTSLKAMGFRAYEPNANFIFFYSHINNLFQKLIDKGILIREYSYELENYYRVSVGSVDENRTFINSLRGIVENEKV